MATPGLTRMPSMRRTPSGRPAHLRSLSQSSARYSPVRLASFTPLLAPGDRRREEEGYGSGSDDDRGAGRGRRGRTGSEGSDGEDDEDEGEVAERTLYERKAALVENELDKFGMGKYQWCIFLLCGSGFLLDLMFAQIFALIASPIQQELGLSPSRMASLFGAFSAGLTIGAFVWGIAVDVWGRKRCFQWTCAFSAGFGVVFPFTERFWIMCVLTALIGSGIGGNVPVDSTITLEFLPSDRRSLLAALSVFQPLGVVLCSLISFFLIPPLSCDPKLPSCRSPDLADPSTPCCSIADNRGWRYAMWTVGGVTVAVFVVRFGVFDFKESPKFLLTKGRDAEAIRILNAIADFNGAPPPDLTLADLDALTLEYPEAPSPLPTRHRSFSHSSSGNGRNEKMSATATVGEKAAMLAEVVVNRMSFLSGLFSNRTLGTTTVLLWIAYVADFWSFTIAGQFLPTIMKEKAVETDVSVSRTYLYYIVIYSCGIPAALLASWMIDIPNLGRKWSMVISAIGMGVALSLYATANSIEALVALNGISFFAQTVLNAILYAFTPEAFPGPVRGSACGFTSTLGRLASILAPVVVGEVIDRSKTAVLYLAGGGAFVTAVALAALPFETKGRQAL